MHERSISILYPNSLDSERFLGFSVQVFFVHDLDSGCLLLLRWFVSGLFMRSNRKFNGRIGDKQEEAQAIEKEEMLMERPASLLREGEDLQWDNPSTSSMRARFETMIRKAQVWKRSSIPGLFLNGVWCSGYSLGSGFGLKSGVED
jgi:hypothetical protein